MLPMNLTSIISRTVLTCVLLSALFGVQPERSVHAATLTVINTNDSGLGSLRQLIADADFGDVITFDASLAGQTITLESDLVLARNPITNINLTIDGSGLSPQVTISGGNVAHIRIPSYATVTFSDLTITNSYGSAIESAGDLTVMNSTLTNNVSPNSGGAINSSGALTVLNSTIAQNQADNEGGAIYIASTLNSYIVNSTVTKNHADHSGGGIFLNGNGATQIINSTFAENSADSYGSEITKLHASSLLIVINSVFACSLQAASCYEYFADIQTLNSILGAGTLDAFGLAPLADNGGPSQTMELLAGSLLIDAGDDSMCQDFYVNNLDQRGVARPQGNHCDIGAYESLSNPIVTKLADTDDGICDSDCSLREAIDAAPVGGTITFAYSLSEMMISLTAPLVIDKDLTIDGSSLSTPITISGNNSVPVFENSATTTLKSLWIAGGDTADQSSGGGVTNFGGNLSILNSIITGNSAAGGGGIYNAGILSIMDSTISSNSATYGGGIQNIGTLNISNTVFSNNSADFGGGILDQAGTVTIQDSSFSQNSAVYNGGGISSNDGLLNLTNNTFSNNTAGEVGGAIYKNGDSGKLSLSRITFSNNAAQSGGAIDNNTEMQVELSTFQNNSGGAIRNSGAEVKVIKSTFSGTVGSAITSLNGLFRVENSTFANNLGDTGGGIHSYADTFTVIHSTFSANSATGWGASIYTAGNGSLTIKNNILANGVQGYDCYNDGSSVVSVNNLMENNGPAGHACGQPTVTADPKLGPLANNSGPTKTMALLPGSPAIDAGDNGSCLATDQRGVTRPRGAACDLGAFEENTTPDTWTVLNTNDSGPGSLRQIMADAAPDDIVVFNPSLAGQTIVLTSELVIDKDLIIDGSALATPITISGDTDGNGTGNVRVFSVNQNISASLIHLIVTKGRNTYGGGVRSFGNLTVTDCTFSDNVASDYGGAIYDGGYTLTVSNSIFTGNSAYDDGGAIYSNSTTSVLTITNSSFSNNSAWAGGAIRNGGILTLTGSTFHANKASSHGGGIEHLGTLTMTDSTFTNNSAYSGGAIHNSGTSNITSSTFANNSAKGSGGGIWNTRTLTLENSTFFSNSAVYSGGAIDSYSYFAVTLVNSTLANNSAAQSGGGIYINGWGTLNLVNTIIADSTSGGDCVHLGKPGLNINNLVEDGSCSALLTGSPNLGPLADHGGLTQTMALLEGSPAIDAGDLDSCPETDQRGLTRPQGQGCDIGSFEYADITPPMVTSIVRADPDSTSASSVRFTVTFTEPVTGVDATDFAITKTGVTGPSISSVTGLDDTYTVTVNTGSGNGTIRLDVVDDDTIVDVLDYPLGGAGKGNGDFSSGETYSVVKSAPIPSVPVPLSPASGALVTSLRPVLDWKDSSPAAHHYQVQVAANSTFTLLVYNETNNVGSSFTPASDLTPGKLYYWRVKAFNVLGGASSWSAVRSFKTPLNVPALLSPTNAQPLLVDRPGFDWNTVSGASQYILQVSPSITFGTLLVNATVNASEYNMTKDLPQNKSLYWRVRAKTAVVQSPWSGTWSFVTGNPPTVPVLVSPANTVLVKDYTPLFNWNNSTAPLGTTFKHYEIQVDDNGDFLSPAINSVTTASDVADSDFTPSTDLASNTRFYWRVRAVNTIGSEDHYSGWSPVWSFRTVILAPQSLTMTPNGLRPSFNWDDASGPGTVTGYTIQVSKSVTFSTFLVNTTTAASSYSVLKDLPSERTLYWRVRVNGANGPSAWSTAQFMLP